MRTTYILFIINFSQKKVMKPIEKPGPFPFPGPPNVHRWYPEDIVIPESLKPSLAERNKNRNRNNSNKAKQKLLKPVYDSINISAENDLLEGEEDGLLSHQQIEQVMEYIKSCCFDASTKEVTLRELEAAFRKHHYAIINQNAENYCRGLMESLDFLLLENNLTVEQWFRQADVRGAIGGDGKVTLLELMNSISKLCQRLDLPDWDRQDALHLLRYMDPSADSDILLSEAVLAFRKFNSPPEYLEVLKSATPIVSKLEEYMHSKHIRVIDLFRSIDSDSSNTISINELQIALLKMFGQRDNEKREKSSTHGTHDTSQESELTRRILEQEENISIGANSSASGWSKFHGILVKNKPRIPKELLHPKDKFKGYVKNIPQPIDLYDDDRTVMSNLSDDYSYASNISKKSGINKVTKLRKPYNMKVKRRVRKLQPLMLSESLLEKMLEIMKISGIDTDALDLISLSTLEESSNKSNIVRVNHGKHNNNNNNSSSTNSNSNRKKADLFSPHYALKSHPMGLEGDSVDVSGIYFQKRLKADLLKHEEVSNRLRDSIYMGKNRLASI